MSLSHDIKSAEFRRGYEDYDRQYVMGCNISCPYLDIEKVSEWHRGMKQAYEDHLAGPS